MTEAKQPQVLITGASGFVGKAVLAESDRRGLKMRAAYRTLPKSATARDIEVSDIHQNTQWAEALDEIDAVIHLAARVHVLNESGPEALEEFLEVNCRGTENLARQAVKAGVKRFVYVSSVKVNGENTDASKAYKADDSANPQDAYAISKHRAEEVLFKISRETGLEVVIVRPPLVYGPGVGANYRKLMTLVRAGIPLPFASSRNLRSMVAVENLADLLLLCVDHPNAAGQVFMVSDDHDIPFSELLKKLSEAMGKKALLFPVPNSLLFAAAALAGKRNIADRLFGSLRVDITKTKELLGWNPVVQPDDAIRTTVRDFIGSRP